MAVELSPPDRLRRALQVKALFLRQRRPGFVLEAVRGNHNGVTVERADHFHVVADVVWLNHIYLLNDVFVVVPAKRKWGLTALRSAAGVRIFGSAGSPGPTNSLREGFVHKIAEVTPRRNVPTFRRPDLRQLLIEPI